MYQYGWFSPNGENVNFGILSKLTFHSLMKEKPLGNKVNKCHILMWAHILNSLNILFCDTTVHMALGWSLVLHSCQLRSHINHLAQTQQTQLSDRQLSYLIRHDKLTPKAGDVFNSIFWNRISGEAGIASKFLFRKLKWTLAQPPLR